MPSHRRFVLAFAVLSLPAAAAAAVNLEATRLAFSRADATYSADETADLVLSHRNEGSATTLRDLMVQVEVRTTPPQRQRFRLRELVVPQGTREFHMPFALKGIPSGTHSVVAWIDSDQAIRE